ncbi:hypothetical protein TNCV_1181491 [Trichonephila clavipes]|nr:hypothetical protein TNCV_1181491 [Trichonephila clavipes]
MRRSSSVMNLRNRYQRGLSKEIRKQHTKSMNHILQEFREASGNVVSINTIRKEALLLGFYGHATYLKTD